MSDRAVVDANTLARLFQSVNTTTRHKHTVHADVVTDLVLCRFLLGQMFGHFCAPSPDCCRRNAMNNVQRYLMERGYLSQGTEVES